MCTILLHIPKSRSHQAKEVITQAAKTGLYDPQTGDLTFQSITSVWQWWDQFSYVVWTAQKWTGFHVAVDDKIQIPYSNDFYYHIQDVRRCWYAYQQNTYKATFCTENFFGCHRLTSIARHPNPGNWDHQCWWRYGLFTDSQTWQVDKRAIYNQLIAEARECFAFSCPQFNERRVRAEVNRLPDTIALNQYWTVDYRASVGRDGPEVVACGIRYNWNIKEDTVLEAPVIGKPDKNASMEEINRYLDDLLKNGHANR